MSVKPLAAIMIDLANAAATSAGQPSQNAVVLTGVQSQGCPYRAAAAALNRVTRVWRNGGAAGPA